MDYLLRDAHYTGLEYGTYDREYLLHHFEVKKVDKKEILTINKNAIHSIEDFLMARFSWYSQVTRSNRGRKYDSVAEKICSFMLEKKRLYWYSDLLEMVIKNPMGFLGFNDNYFLGKVQECLALGIFKENPKIEDMANCLLLEKGVKSIKHPDLRPQLLNQDEQEKYLKVRNKAQSKVEEISNFLKSNGGNRDWILAEVETKDISFVKSLKKNIKGLKTTNVLLERDPVKISYDNGQVKLLAEVDNSIISILQNTSNYIPNLFCSQSAYDLLLKANIIVE
jgi:HD superfamily phosphohydrolase